MQQQPSGCIAERQLRITSACTSRHGQDSQKLLLKLCAAGSMSATIRHLDAGGIASPGAPVHAPILRSPCLARKHLLEVRSPHARLPHPLQDGVILSKDLIALLGLSADQLQPMLLLNSISSRCRRAAQTSAATAPAAIKGHAECAAV